ncbi:metal ABC transporter ATP-binding protein [Leptospira sp. GIMC2001]|uniref:metal ABC transporter ATP-binding protein n=1 Tax=Leptospira sp. GIMC2001 TaxID=1513297 RepID=UPI0004A5C5DB|nr:ATP-binding cassette domain-containing protein [Leptospira sp. GIMC2001]AID56183.1 zinc ABC transporter ATP-binding protein ZnuC [Leptospira sp. GIMC2001]WCL48356.1 ATP-binding cassette domain-containing protein [Leptospira sp. GIMC2001]
MLFTTKDLSVGYRADQVILRHVDIAMLEGQIVALVGANGSGKTSLVRTITGLLKPLSGSYEFAEAVSNSLVPQAKSLKLEFPLTIRDALAMSQSISRSPFFRWTPTSNELELMEKIGILEIQDLLLRECSGGQLQKYLIARSLLSGAKLVFLDEPMDALDEKSQKDIFDVLKEKASDGVGFFIITHNLSQKWLNHFDQVLKIQDKDVIKL